MGLPASRNHIMSSCSNSTFLLVSYQNTDLSYRLTYKEIIFNIEFIYNFAYNQRREIAAAAIEDPQLFEFPILMSLQSYWLKDVSHVEIAKKAILQAAQEIYD